MSRFCGEFVVNCVAKPGQLCGFAPRLKVGQDSNKYFLRALGALSSHKRGWAVERFRSGELHRLWQEMADRRVGGWALIGRRVH